MLSDSLASQVCTEFENGAKLSEIARKFDLSPAKVVEILSTEYGEEEEGLEFLEYDYEEFSL